MLSRSPEIKILVNTLKTQTTTLTVKKADRHEPLLLLPQQIKRTERMQTKPHTLFCCADAECAVR